MRILVICSHFPPQPSPEGTHAMMLCENLALQGGDVHLLTSPLLKGAPLPKGYKIYPEITTWAWSGAAQIVSAAKKIQPDVILLIYVGWIYGNHPMITFAPSFLRRAGVRSRFVTQFENVLGASVTNIRERIKWVLAAAYFGTQKRALGTLVSSSAGVITLSERHRDVLITANPGMSAKMVNIPAPPLLRVQDPKSGDTRADARSRFGLSESTFVLLYFGYVYAGKGMETLLEAIAILQERAPLTKIPSFKLLVVGSVVPDMVGKIDELQQRLGVSKTLIWLGRQEDDECSAYLHAADLAVLPFDEGIRLNNSSFAVCASHGLPILTTRGNELEPAFQHATNVFLCRPQDPNELAGAIEHLMNDPVVRLTLARGAGDMADEVFSWGVVTKATWGVLRSSVSVGTDTE